MSNKEKNKLEARTKNGGLAKKNSSKKETKSKVKKDDKKAVIYVEAHEEITSIFGKIQKQKEKEVYIVVPKDASIFSSVINLKILKRKSEEIKKEIIIVTTDSLGYQLCETAGIEVFKRMKEERLKFKFASIDGKEATFQKKDSKKKDSSAKKISISEVVEQNKEDSEDIPQKKEQATTGEKNPYLLLRSPNRIWLAFFFLSSILFFMLVAYIAFPSAVIRVTPESDRIEYKGNFTIADYNKNASLFKGIGNDQLVPAVAISVEFERKLKFPATGERRDLKHAKGKIRIFNKSRNDKYFVPSRFATKDGIVFRNTKPINVPKATIKKKEDGTEETVFGFLDVEVVADERDVNGDIIGKRGNIDPTFFTMPAIPNLSPSFFWAQSFEPMSGGDATVKKFVSEEDLKSAEIQARQQMIEIGKEELRKKNEERNKKEGKNSAVLEDEKAFSNEVVEVKIPEWLKDKFAEEFEVFVKLKMTGLVFNKEQVVNTCKKNIRNNVHPDKKLAFVDENSFKYSIIERNMQLGRYKITATIEGREEYELSVEKESGLKLVHKIKEEAMGKPVQQAENLINNFEEISKVKIKNEPFWAFTIPTLLENIEVVLLEN